ncbi:MAG TPA: cupin domain-containing protein [Candidatus Sulfotelmatobacter sp.]|nr:cupin domain-containing protein [Candidatus Sulfotelmatobacter sp.]
MDGNSPSTLADKLAGRVARFADRREDWTVFGFETARDPRFARAQRRYLGASGSVDPSDLRGAVPASAFTMSIQTMPPGNRIPVHCHETEEVFFILDGACLVRCWEGGTSHEIRLGRWDLVALPPFLQHEVLNDGPVDCHVQTLLGHPKPLRPNYADPELLRLQEADGAAQR